MKKVFPLFGSAIGIILFMSCMRYVTYKNFNLNKTAPTLSNFKINGLYVLTNGNLVEGVNSSGIQFRIYYFYSDGTFGQTGYFGKNVTNFIEKIKSDIAFSKDTKADMDKFKRWGRYQTIGQSIEIQYFARVNEIKYDVYEEKGQILSDSSFVIKTQTFYYKGAGDTTKNIFKLPYHFNFYSCDNCKPDSVNWLMKRKS